MTQPEPGAERAISEDEEVKAVARMILEKIRKLQESLPSWKKPYIV